MKKVFIILSVLLLAVTATAKPVDPTVAILVAKNHVAQYVKNIDGLNAEVVYTHPMSKSGKPAMYAINVGSAFVLVAADDVAHPVLGYNLGIPWPTGERCETVSLPSHVSGYLDDLAAQIEAAVDQHIELDREILAEWQQLTDETPLYSSSNLPDSVGPLLTTSWDQALYYNALCPTDTNGPDGHVLTGCVATAMAQIINYWGYPVHGRGIHSYHSDHGTLTVNYDSATYDYANMPSSLTATSTPAQVNAVAKLMYDCGVAANMTYGSTESGSFDVDARAGMINFFRFSANASYAEKNNFSNSEWTNLLHTNLTNNQPVMYGGNGTDGHAFVCDGFKSGNYFHFNFGWSGYADGWYITNAVNPAGNDFNSNQSAILGIVPDSTGNVILGQMKGTSIFTVDEPLEFYHLLGHNAYYGVNYTNTCANHVYFIPRDSTLQLVLDVYDFHNQEVVVYDMSGTQMSLLSSDSVNNTITSVDHGFNLLYQGWLDYLGFHIGISQDDGCRTVSDLKADVDTTTVTLSWKENSGAIQWQVEYGVKGFNHGEGTLLTVYDTTAIISGLPKFTEYDFYVRPICGNDSILKWHPVLTVMTEAPYWHEMVISEPSSYTEDSTGHVYISSAEGLAWFAKLTELGHFGYRNIHVEVLADINLAQYKWKPINFAGVFDGKGHVIDSLIAIENRISGSFFNTDSLNTFENGISASFFSAVYNNSTIKNIMITNCRLYSKGNIGLIADAFSNSQYIRGMDTIINCFVSGQLYGEDALSIGAIVGGGSAKIFNCASNCTITGTAKNVGGIIGGSINDGYSTSIIKNCYSACLFDVHANNQAYIYSGDIFDTIENCYSSIDHRRYRHITSGLNFYKLYYGNSLFSETDSGCYMTQPLFFDCDSMYYENLKDVLNAGVRKFNVVGSRLWVDDTMGINGGMPIMGPEYVVTCPNIQNLVARSVVDSNFDIGIELSWREVGSADRWEIKYHKEGSDSVMTVVTMSNPDTLMGGIMGFDTSFTYLFNVRPVCENNDRGGWSYEVLCTFDIPRWTDVVKAEPAGYVMDSDSNVTISTAEGLAWLISVVNGLNGQTAFNFKGKRVTVTQNIDIGQYRWVAIDGFKGVFDGGGKTIKNLYLNELWKNVGLFGTVNNARFINVVLDSVFVNGNSTGMLIGYADSCNVVNCSVSGVASGDGHVGGIVGEAYGLYMNACNSSGAVLARGQQSGGLLGLGDASSTIRNSYSRCDVLADGYDASGLCGGVPLIENCYAVGDVTNYLYAGGITAGSTDMANCYFGGTVHGTGYVCMTLSGCGFRKGTIAGVVYPYSTMSNCYGLSDSENPHPLVGMAEHEEPFVISDTATFTVAGNSALLLDSVSVGQNRYNNLLDALNAWVDYYDKNGIYLHWVSDTSGVNGGMPILEKVNYYTLNLYVADSTPYGFVKRDGNSSYIVQTEISAIPDYGYRFIRWNDGNTQNPRNVFLTQDTSFTAIFGIDDFYVIGTSNVSVDYTFDFEDSSLDSQWSMLIAGDEDSWYQRDDNVNRWFINELEGSNRALFISNNYGDTNTYSSASRFNAFAYTTLLLDSGWYSYSYDWRCQGDVYNDFAYCLIAPSSEIQNVIEWECAWSINHGELPHNVINASGYYDPAYGWFDVLSRMSEWTEMPILGDYSRIYIPKAGEYKMIMVWHNTYLGFHLHADPPAAIDNIHLFNSVPAERNNYGYVLGSDTVQYLDTVTLTAIPNPGFHFERWSDGNTENPRTVVADSNKFYVAVFDYDRQNVTVQVSDTTPHGTVSGSGSYNYEESIIISATADYGYLFEQWDDGNTDNPREITVYHDTTFTALFVKKQYYVLGNTDIGVDYIFDFEDSTLDQMWTFQNEDYENRWCINTVDDTNRALFISADNGQTNTYNGLLSSDVYAFTEMMLDSGIYQYSFDWRCNGDDISGSRIALVPVSENQTRYDWNTILSSQNYIALDYHRIASGIYGWWLRQQPNWTTISSTFNVPVAGNYRLVCYWHYYNHGITENQPPAAFDNIHIYNNISTDDNHHGYVFGSDTVPYLDTVILTAVPDDGYQFVRWSDGNTDNPRTVIADNNHYYIAIFNQLPTNVIVTGLTICSEGFEYADDMWTFQNGNSENRWYIAMLDDTNRALFISNDGGLHNDYSENDYSSSFAYITLHLPVGQHNYCFNWRCYAETVFDYLRVALVPDTTALQEGDWSWCSLPAGAIALDGGYYLVNQTTWTNQSGSVEVPSEGDYRMVFYWHNDGSVKHTPPAAINNIQIDSGIYMECHGIVLGSDTVPYLDTVILTAVPDDGYQFVRWGDGNTDNPRHVVATGNMSLSALFERESYTGSDTIIVCDSYNWHDITYTTSTELIDTLAAIDGSDSIVTHNIIIAHPTHTATIQEACESYSWNDSEYTISGEYTYIHLDSNGCTQVDTLHLTINTPAHSSISETACDIFTWNGTSYNNSGAYYYSHTDANGCTQFDTLYLSINNPVHGATTEVACDNYTWNGTEYTLSGNYTYSHSDANGCTQVDTLHLTINYSNTGDTTATACDEFTWWNTNYTNSTNEASHVFSNPYGCDSVVTLHLTVNYSNTGDTTAVACDSFTWWNTNYANSTNEATQTLTNVAGCDSVVTLHLTVNYSNTGVETVTACETYNWHGITYTASTSTPTYTETNAVGCDSVVTLNLTINYNNTGIETVTECDSYFWHGTTFTATNNTATYTTTNAVGCDSVVTLNLTINYSTTATETVTDCDSYTWHGTTYTASGTDTYSTTNAAGCDSTVTLNLIINYSTIVTETVTECDSYTWHGQTYTSSTDTPTYTTQNAVGCDSTVTLNLTINYSVEATIADTADGSYTWNGTTYTESGTYQWQGTTTEGCDSTVTLLLVINSVGIELIDGNGMVVNVYPNPTTGWITIDADDVLSVEVFDQTGRHIVTHDNTNRINLGGLATGNYVLRIHLQRGNSVQRVILK